MAARDQAFDVVVAGGGPAGATTALLLSRAGVSTLLIDPARSRPRKVGETLPPVATALLHNLGVWEAFVRDEHLPSEGIVSVWGSGDPRVNDFFAGTHGLGWNLDRSSFDAMLLEHSQRAGARLALGTRVISCESRAAAGWYLSIAGPEGHRNVSARYLVDATGRTGTVALRCLSPRLVHDRLIGVVACFHEDEPNAYTVVEALEDGWFYSTSVPNRTLVVVYLSDADIFADEEKSREDRFQAQLVRAPHTRSRVAEVRRSEALFIVSAASSRRKTVAGPSWIAVGDAAFSFDPLSSLGIFKALDSANRAFESILDGLGGKPLTHGYQDWCNDVFRSYLQNRLAHYRSEPRWAESLFWRRRQASAV
jgi:flavin-dependent dehydrogenase